MALEFGPSQPRAGIPAPEPRSGLGPVWPGLPGYVPDSPSPIRSTGDLSPPETPLDSPASSGSALPVFRFLGS